MGQERKSVEDREAGQDDSLFEWRRRNVLQGWTLGFLAILLLFFLVLLWKAVPVLLLLFAGVLIAVALRFMSDSFSRLTRIPPRWSLAIVLVVLVVGIGVGGYLMAPSIYAQTSELAKDLRESVSTLEEGLRSTPVGQFVLSRIRGLEDAVGDSSDIWGRAAGMFTTTFGAIGGLFLTLAVGVFLAFDPALYRRGILRLVPLQKRSRAGEILDRLAYVLRWWIVGQLISMVFLAVSTWLILWILGVPLALVLALLAGLLTFIPYLGPIIAAVPIVLVAFVESPTLAMYVLIAYLVIQNLEGNVLIPIIMQRTVELPPVLTIVAQVLLGGIFGFTGILLATPLMAVGLELIKMIYVEDVLRDDFEQPVERPVEHPVKAATD